ncbi:hypothetical protein [Methanoculleus chikugoensis]|uniref:hypothetical protein n=1 Tax=Methanoculleus chikugoensis TaxID=118126 RepID=UPI001FB27846|nr:hypothetical protein [Methanoculleus chikugoensis]
MTGRIRPCPAATATLNPPQPPPKSEIVAPPKPAAAPPTAWLRAVCTAEPAPSFGKGCRGCCSEKRKQRHTSKGNCTIRRCCFEEKGIALRSQCTDVPCRLTDELQGSYPGNERFRYRHKIYENLQEIEEQAPDAWLPGGEKAKRRRPVCGKTIVFYHYRCPAYGYEPGRRE